MLLVSFNQFSIASNGRKPDKNVRQMIISLTTETILSYHWLFVTLQKRIIVKTYLQHMFNIFCIIYTRYLLALEKITNTFSSYPKKLQGIVLEFFYVLR